MHRQSVAAAPMAADALGRSLAGGRRVHVRMGRRWARRGNGSRMRPPGRAPPWFCVCFAHALVEPGNCSADAWRHDAQLLCASFCHGGPPAGLQAGIYVFIHHHPGGSGLQRSLGGWSHGGMWGPGNAVQHHRGTQFVAPKCCLYLPRFDKHWARNHVCMYGGAEGRRLAQRNGHPRGSGAQRENDSQ